MNKYLGAVAGLLFAITLGFTIFSWRYNDVLLMMQRYRNWKFEREMETQSRQNWQRIEEQRKLAQQNRSGMTIPSQNVQAIDSEWKYSREADYPTLQDDNNVAKGTKDLIAPALCHDRPNCKLVSTASAGKDSSGNEIIVAEAADVVRCVGDDCGIVTGQIWLMSKYDQQVSRKQLLVAMKAYYRPRTTATTKPNQFVYDDHVDGMGSGHGITVTMQLSPLAILKVSRHSGGRDFAFRRSYSWDTLDGTATGSVDDNGDNYFRSAFSPVPLVQGTSDWLTNLIPLGSCALTLGSVESPGSVLAGVHDHQAIPQTKIVMPTAEDLLIQVAGGPHVTDSPNWLYDDHLELWLAEDRSVKPVQWGIRVADGVVFPAYGHPKAPLLVRWHDLRDRQSRAWRLFHVHLPFKPGRVAVSYSKGNGTRVTQMLSTSQIVFGRASTLGTLRKVAPSAGECAESNGMMEFRQRLRLDPAVPVVSCENFAAELELPEDFSPYYR